MLKPVGKTKSDTGLHGQEGSQNDDDADGGAMSHDVVGLQVHSHEDGDKDMGHSHLDACLDPQEAPSQPVNAKDGHEGGAHIHCTHHSFSQLDLQPKACLTAA